MVNFLSFEEITTAENSFNGDYLRFSVTRRNAMYTYLVGNNLGDCFNLRSFL